MARAILRLADIRRLVRGVNEGAPGSTITIDIDQKRVHIDLAANRQIQQSRENGNELDWLLNGDDKETGAA